MKTPKWGHNVLARDLATYLRKTKGVLTWEDMQLGPAGSPRPDVYTIGKSFARFMPIVYEVKVTAADFRRDVTSGKWQNYLQFASAVVFAAPAGLISKNEIPPGCGLIVRSDAVWRMQKGPILSRLETLPHDAWMKLLLDGIDREAERVRLKQRPLGGGLWVRDQKIRQRHGEEVAELVHQALRAKDQLQSAIAHDDERRKEIKEGTEHYTKMYRDRIERQMATLNTEQQHLARSLGLSAEATIRDLTSAIRRAQMRLGEDDEINRLRRLFDQVKDLADKGLEPLPGAQATAD